MKLLKLSRIGSLVEADLADFGPRLDDLGEGLLLEIGSAFDRIDQVWNQVSSALIDVLDLTPGCVSRLFECYEVVVGTAPSQRDQQNRAD